VILNNIDTLVAVTRMVYSLGLRIYSLQKINRKNQQEMIELIIMREKEIV